MSRYKPAKERFFKKVFFDKSGCWLWRASLNSDGYAQFRVNGKTVGAHRWYFTYTGNVIPKGFTLDHTCRVRNCVNPAHLEPVTHQENCSRRIGLRTTCPKGHSYLVERNVYYDSKGYRRCKECKRINDRRRRRRERIYS